MSPRRRGAPAGIARVRIDDLDRAGRGVGQVDGKAVHVDSALPGEEVEFGYHRGRGRTDQGIMTRLLVASPQRETPRCPHFGVCGACSLQHLAGGAQVQAKERRLALSLSRIGGVVPESRLEPITASPWGYRRRARLAVRHVPGKGGALVGFSERRGSKIAEIERCEVLAPAVGERIRALRDLISACDARDRIPQIEVAAGDRETALVIRHLSPLGAADRARLTGFAREHGLQVWLQAAGPDSVVPLWPEVPPPIGYSLPEFEVEIRATPGDFIQVNAAVNRALVRAAVDLLGPRAGDRILDLFCGVGNFSLALGRRAGQVLGLEGEPALVCAARDNARRNRLDNVDFQVADLAAAPALQAHLGQRWNALLLDPPRGGAAAVVEGLRAPYPARIVYISCDPETLARDAGVLVARHGYRLRSAGVADMFPHTNHCEAIALLERGEVP